MLKDEIRLNYRGLLLNCTLNDSGDYVSKSGNVFEVLDYGEKEINGAVFDTISISCNREYMMFVYNPISDCWWLVNADGIPWLSAKNVFKPIKCDKLKYIAFPISKNGCSCLVKSALHYDNHISKDETESDKFVWQDSKNNFAKVQFNILDRNNFLERFAGYKMFVVLQPENERFVRFLNWSHKAKYNTYYNFGLSLDDSKKEHEWAMPLLTIDPYCCDQHALSQDKHLDIYIDKFFNSDRELFKKSVEVVQLANLPEWFEKTFGEKMIMNNIDKPEDWLYNF